MFFGKDSGLRPKEAPANMLIAMAIAAALCVFIGVYPDPMYALMPAVVDYNPYTTGHILWELQLLPVTARFVRDIGSRLWQATLGALMDRMRWVMANLSRYHGPKGVLASTWPTGSMVLWVAVILVASLVIYYV